MRQARVNTAEEVQPWQINPEKVQEERQNVKTPGKQHGEIKAQIKKSTQTSTWHKGD